MNALYSIDSKGKTRIWRQEIKDNGYRTISGIKDGNLVYSEWTICEGKNIGKSNETTPAEQARLEVAAKYEKQLKTGYSNTELGAAKGTSYVEPMLAKLYTDYEDKINFSKEQWLVQCKFNGNRCIATTDGLFTRKGEKYLAVPHIEDSLKDFFQKYPRAVIDGELYNYSLREQLNELSKLIRRTVHITAEDLKESEDKVCFYIYDGYNFSPETSQEKSYSIRKNWIDKNLLKYKYIKEVKSYSVKNTYELEKYYNEFLEDQQEGAILRRADMGYENKRTKNLLKIKPTDDDEFEVIDVEEGIGNRSKMAGRVILKMNDGRTFAANLKGTFQQFKEVLDNKKEYIGKRVTIFYNGFTGLGEGKPNYAQFDCSQWDKADR